MTMFELRWSSKTLLLLFFMGSVEVVSLAWKSWFDRCCCVCRHIHGLCREKAFFTLFVIFTNEFLFPYCEFIIFSNLKIFILPDDHRRKRMKFLPIIIFILNKTVLICCIGNNYGECPWKILTHNGKFIKSQCEKNIDNWLPNGTISFTIDRWD